MPRICLIHAVEVAIEPVQQAFARLWPESTCTNLLDDSLALDRARNADLTSDLSARIAALAHYAVSTGADGVLFTCSAFGKAIEEAARQVDIPVLKPNEAMFQTALAMGDDIGMLATFAPAVAGMEDEFRTLAAEARRPNARIRTVCVPEAMAALQAGDAAAHNRLLAEAAGQLCGCDAVLLGQFSTARAEDSVRAGLGDRTLTSPAAAVARLRQRLGGA